MIKNKFTIKNGIAEVEVKVRGEIRICYLNEEVLDWPQFAGRTITYAGVYPVVCVKHKNIYIHLEVAKYLGLDSDELDTDHIDQNKFNAVFTNIRKITHGQNIQNSKARNKTGYKGVSPFRDKYRALISVTDEIGKHNYIYLGTYKTAQEAARAYDIAAKKYFGETACINGISEDIVLTRLTHHDKRKKCNIDERY